MLTLFQNQRIFLRITYYCLFVHTSSTDSIMMCVLSYIEHLYYLICFLHHKNASVIIVTTSVDNTFWSASAYEVLLHCGLTQKSWIFNVQYPKKLIYNWNINLTFFILKLDVWMIFLYSWIKFQCKIYNPT